MSKKDDYISSEDCKRVILQVYENRYFSNHGPLAKKFEAELEVYFNTRNAVAVTNNALAILIAIFGSDNGKKIVLLEGFEKDAFDAINMSGVDFITMTIDDLLGRSCKDVGLLVTSSKTLVGDNIVFLDELIRGGAVVVTCFPSISRCVCNNLEGAISVYSLGAGSVVQGGVITTDNNELAEVFRNIRSSYGTRKMLEVKATCNGRFSELQAGLGLELLSKLRKNT